MIFTLYELKNGKGYVKEYNKYNELKFEGEYLNGVRNGMGKEYGVYGNVIYEGNFLNGERHGQCKIHNDYKGYLEFEGEYIDKVTAKGKKYDSYGNLIFEGEYLNGRKWNGYEKKYDESNNLEETLMIEGEILNGIYNGKYKEYYENDKLKFEGEYLNGKKWNGKEYDINNNIYEIKDGKGSIKEYNFELFQVRYTTPPSLFQTDPPP